MVSPLFTLGQNDGAAVQAGGRAERSVHVDGEEGVRDIVCRVV